jgi:transposase
MAHTPVTRNKSSKKQQSKTRATKTRSLVAQGPLPVPRGLLSAGIPLDPDIEMERQQRMEVLKSELVRQMARGEGMAAIDRVLCVVQELELENERLAWRVLRANRYRFGRSTERLSREEIRQLYLAFAGDAECATAESELPVPAPEQPEQVDSASAAEGDDNAEPTKSKPKKKRERVQRMKARPDVERNVRDIPIPQDERTCALCGGDKKVFGHVEHEVFRFVPAKIVVDVERREKAACEHCRKDVSVAPRQQVPQVVRKVDASLLAKLVADKTSMALPLDRQRREIARLGLEIPDKTLASYWAYTTDLLEPVATAVTAEVFGSKIVGVDDSHLKTLDKSSKHGTFRGHLWCFVGTDGIIGAEATPERVAYGYTQSWEADETVDWFSAIEGFIQCDGYAGYSRQVEDEDGGQTIVAVPPERRLGCGMHIRSKFHAALLANDRRAAVPLKHFADLYQIEAECKERGLNAYARAEERRRRSLPILDALYAWLTDIHPKLLPKSPLRRATTYAKNQWEFFRRCFEDGRFDIDNGRVERRIRNFAVGRRNYLFTGSVRGGERLAIAYTLVDNCTILGIDPYRYLVDVITKLESGWPLRRLSELLPWRWLSE